MKVARVLLRHLEGEAHGAVRALVAGRVDDGLAVEPQQSPPLLGRVVGHHARQLVALELRDERERDAGVAARRLEELAAGLTSSPDASPCSSIIDFATRSLIEPVGFSPSSFA